jgi:ketosteroid isomerase-like protein/mono/diheme cytochrome c family protein
MPFVTRKSLFALGLLAVAAAVAGGAFLWSGLYDIGADDHHTRPVYAALETLRDRSIATRANSLTVPDLTDVALIRQGAGNYDAMCSGCHLAPGKKPTELSRGLYPAPPNFSRGRLNSPAHHFWAIKHGIKASGMPAWGTSMEDRYIWGLVALVQRLPDLDAAQYQALVTSSQGHSHGGGEAEHSEAPAHSPDRDHHEHGMAATEATSEDAAPVAVVERFGAALAKGDLATAESLLDPQVLILESGGAEQSRAEYMGHHAGADAKFLRAATVHPGRRRVSVGGDLAWVGSESELHAHEGGKPITLLSTETMVLRRHDGAWRIVHIHWSSRPRS